MKITPKQFLKTRRPGQFSDSEIISESQIDSTVLEFYLDTLATRSQEVEFERFGIRLCKAAITPNILPNTGPTGGGDGKVDSETYPISEITALGWYTSIDPKTANERWGFAFSVQKTWGAKIRADIKKIFETGRDYKVAYYVSSRPIRAKDKARIQDELKEAYKIDVRILDRTWILKQVFENKHQDIVKEELQVEGITETKIKKGPLDSQKEDLLTELDKDVEKTISESKVSSSVVDDAIRSAILSRELEKPRVEIDGRFARAERLAKEFGSDYQQFEAAYQLAWTTFWWHEDFPTYLKLYQPVEDLVLKTEHVYNLERLTNLWYGLNNLRNQDKKGEELVTDEFFQQHTETLKKKLQEITTQKEEKPNAALYARALLLEIELAENRFSGESMDKTLANLKEVVEESRNLVGFPFKPLVQVLTEIGEAFEESPEYDGLFQTILKVTEERDGETAAAKLSLNRAEKLIELERPYEVIRSLGTSLRKLHKHESRDDAVRALFLIAIAYEEVGLFWAARGALLSAASLATSELWSYGEVNTMQAACYKRLKWLELRLGRIPQALDWNNVDSAIRNALVNKGYRIEGLVEQVNRFDMALGILFLRADLDTLKTLESLSDSLFEMGLDFSPVALIYALGWKDKIPADFTSAIPAEEMDDFFVKWAEQYSPEYLPPSIMSTELATVKLASNVLGCKIIVNTENQSPCIEVAESILSAIESFLSTLTPKHAASKEALVEINIDSSATKDLIQYEIDDNKDRPVVNVHCQKFNPHSVTRSDQEKLKDVILDILVHTIARFVMFKDREKYLKTLMRDERASERASNFTSSFITLGNVLGHNPKIKISDYTDSKKQKYKLNRTEALQFAPSKEETDSEKPTDPLEKTFFSKMRHNDIETISVIRESFWDNAKWLGAGYLVMPDRPPVLSILFNNIESGKKIFTAWQEKFGREDKDEEIRVAIVQDIDKTNPLHYVVGIGSSLKLGEHKGNPRFVVSPTRRHTMTPHTLENLDNFKKAYSYFGYYLLAPGLIGTDGLPDILFKYGILKKEIYFRKADEIGINDLDIILLNKKQEK